MSEQYEAVIGLEIHAELATKTKLFCGCPNDPFHAPAPNIFVCPVCLGLPGTLPVMNRQAVEWSAMVGLALGCQVGWQPANSTKREANSNSDSPVASRHSLFTKWDRKNYFYPDLPKGYQISQYDLPINHTGKLALEDREIAITRIHLEEDTGKLLHPPGAQYSLLDYNRVGVPLLELVTEPVIRTAQEASAFAKLYQLTLRTLGVANADMEKGEMRVEANVSVRQRMANGESPMGTKVEVKNLNSFRSVERAIDYEIQRQIEAIEAGESIRQETRGWNESKEVTFVQRVKETAADYRYFPEPDLPPVVLGKLQNPNNKLQTQGIDLEAIRTLLPELPWIRKARYQTDFGLNAHDADRLVSDKNWTAYFESIQASTPESAQLVAKWILNELPDTTIRPEHLLELAEMVGEGEVTGKLAKELFPKMRSTGEGVRAILKKEGISVVRDAGALRALVQEVIEAHPDAVSEYRAGKQTVLGFLIGQAMAASRGQADPALVREELVRALKEEYGE